MSACASRAGKRAWLPGLVGALALMVALAVPGAAWAEEAAWVTDRLEVTLRRGTGTQFAIVRMLPAGARLEVLERDAESGYTRVRTDQGVEGWVLTRYLVDQPSAREQLADMRQRLDQALAQRGSAGEMLDAMTAERNTLREERDALAAANRDLTEELAEIRAAAAEPLQMRERARALAEENAALESRVATLSLETRDLRRSTQRDWLLAGAAVLLVGLVLGIVLPRIRWRRRSRWSDL